MPCPETSVVVMKTQETTAPHREEAHLHAHRDKGRRPHFIDHDVEGWDSHLLLTGRVMSRVT